MNTTSFFGTDFLAFWSPSPFELLVILIVALLLFGKRLPDVARSLGKGMVEFKKGLKGVEDDIEQSSRQYEPPKTPPVNRPEPTYTQEKSPSSSGPSASGPPGSV